MRTKYLFLICTFCTLYTTIFSQVPDYLWAKSAGGLNANSGQGVCTDASGNVIVVGYFMSRTIFGTDTLYASWDGGATNDIFIVKYDPLGNVLWAQKAGGIDDDFARSVTTDASGNIYVTGSFWSHSIIFGTDTLVNVNPTGGEDIFIVKYDASGNELWAHSSGGTNSDEAFNICTDTYGNAFITGYFYSPMIIFGTDTLMNSGDQDIFIVKYDASGNVHWAKNAVGAYGDWGKGVAADASGNVYLTGYFWSSSITFGTTTTLMNTHSGSSPEAFIIKYNNAGNVLWAKQPKGTGDDEGESVAVDQDGNALVTGYFHSPTLIFGTDTLTESGGYYNSFLVKYDTLGTVLWAKKFSGANQSYSVSTDAENDIYLTGGFMGPTATIFGAYTLNSSTSAYEDIFIAKLNGAGNVLWAQGYGGTRDDLGISICTDASGSVILTGFFFSPAATFGSFTLTNEDLTGHSSNIFVVKLGLSLATGVPLATEKDNTDYLVYPNPNNGAFSIISSTGVSKIEVMNMLGEYVYSTDSSHLKNADQKIDLDLSGQSSGIYFVRLSSEKGSVTKKISINK